MGAVYDRCGDAYDWGGSANVYIIGGPIQPLDACGSPNGKYLLLWNPAGSSPNEQYAAADGQPSGTTYKWQISSGSSKAHKVGPDTEPTVALTADAEGDLTLKLTYTKGTKSCVSYLDTAVQKPNQGYSSVTCDGWSWFCGWPGNQYMEATREVYYYVRDGANRPVQHARWNETWSGGCNLTEGDIDTDCNGRVWDHFWVWWPRYCDGDGVICSDNQTITVAGWANFWSNQMSFNDGGGPTDQNPPYCPYIDLAGRGCPSCQ